MTTPKGVVIFCKFEDNTLIFINFTSFGPALIAPWGGL